MEKPKAASKRNALNSKGGSSLKWQPAAHKGGPTPGGVHLTWLDTSARPPTSVRPKLDRMGFIGKFYIREEWAPPRKGAGHHYNPQPGARTYNDNGGQGGGFLHLDKLTITTIALGVGCFVTTVAVVMVVLWTVMRRRRARAARGYRRSGRGGGRAGDKAKLVSPVDIMDHYGSLQQPQQNQQPTRPRPRLKMLRFLSRQDSVAVAGAEETKSTLGIMPSILLRRSISTDSDSGELLNSDHEVERIGGDTQAFVNEFSDYISSEDGEVLSPESDVSLLIPQGAVVPAERLQQVTVKVALGNNSYCPLPLKPDERVISPVVVCSAPGQEEAFARPLVVKIPHHISLNDGEWSVRVVAATETPRLSSVVRSWQNVRFKDPNKRQSMCYCIDDKYVYVETQHLHTYAVLGKAKKGDNSGLRLCAAVYGNCRMRAGKPELSVRVHLCEQYADAQKVSLVLIN
jgi:hypothetical protein